MVGFNSLLGRCAKANTVAFRVVANYKGAEVRLRCQGMDFSLIALSRPRLKAAAEVEELVDVLRNFGPRAGDASWRGQARSVLRTFLGRSRDFADEPEYVRLVALQEEIRRGEE